MVEVGAPDECIEEMRSFLHLEGWSQPQDLLPIGWMLRIAENKCSLMRDSGEIFEDWTGGLKCLEGLGKDTKKLKDFVAKKLDHKSSRSDMEVLLQDKGTLEGDSDHLIDFKVKQETTGTETVHMKINESPNKLEIFVDNVKNEEKRNCEKITEDVSQRLPKGWRTRNKLGDKGFRIYSPPGFEHFVKAIK